MTVFGRLMRKITVCVEIIITFAYNSSESGSGHFLHHNLIGILILYNNKIDNKMIILYIHIIYIYILLYIFYLKHNRV